MNEETNSRNCPICRQNTLADGEDVCPRCRYVLDKLFPDGWAGMDYEDLHEHYVVGGDDYAYEYEETQASPEMLEEYHPELADAQPEEQGFLDRNWKKLLAGAIVLAAVLLLVILHLRS